LQKHLQNRGIQTLIHYPVPIHHQESCKGVIRDCRGLSASEQHATSCLSIPCHPQMSDENVADVISEINSFREA
jgi:dTDP-4-amino-4,6-dideoxygalactose transaminase